MNEAATNTLRISVSLSTGLAILIYLALANSFIIVNFNNLVQDQSKWYFTPLTTYYDLKEISELVEYKSIMVEITDGLGRKVEPSSWLIRHIFGSNKLSAGLGWQFFDGVLLLIASIIAFAIYPEKNHSIRHHPPY